MSKAAVTDLRRRFLEALPDRTIDEFASVFYFKGSTKAEKIERIARVPGNLIPHVLAFDVSATGLKQAARAVGIDLQGLRGAGEIADHVCSVFAEWEQALRRNKPLPSFSDSRAEDDHACQVTATLREESERLAQPVLYLKARKSSKTTSSPVAGWNAKLSTNRLAGVWLRVDLRAHPNARLRTEGVLSVAVDPRTGDGTAHLVRGNAFIAQPGERPLYAEETQDLPGREVLQIKGSRSTRELLAAGGSAVEDYESVNPTDRLTRTQVYAQLGGWPVTWPEQSADEQLQEHMVLRTYRDAEPWIEVFRSRRRYECRVRIT